MASEWQISIFDLSNAHMLQTPSPVKSEAPTYLSKGWLENVYVKIIEGVQDYFQRHHFRRAVIGVSGGVDSCLTLKLAVDALGADNVTAVLMPEHGVSRDENVVHAKVLCDFFGVHYYYQPINNFVSDLTYLPWKPNQLAIMNTKARIRSVLLYSFANTEKALVLGTSNKTEILLGYGTKFGDLAADIEVIGSLYKTEVIALADFLGMPPEIVHKTPSAELLAGQSDESEIGAPYPDLDKVLMKRDLGVEGCVALGMPIALVQLVFRRIEENEHKRNMPPVVKI